MQHDLSALHTWVFNTLQDQIAVIDREGTIIAVNRAWTMFGIENGLSPESAILHENYFQVLNDSATRGDTLAGDAAKGMMAVVNGERSFYEIEYPCHSPSEQRWFIMRVCRVQDATSDLFVISHHNITQRKLAEERAEHLAMHDPLTGLANRRYFNSFLQGEMRRSLRNKTPISLVVIDVDNFKDYNDTLGHLFGDECLVKVAKTLINASRRPGDLAARLGGDEFALILGDTDMAGAQSVAEGILKHVRELNIVFAESRHVTVSIGVASMIPYAKPRPDYLLHEADKALYRSKLAGRNQVNCQNA